MQFPSFFNAIKQRAVVFLHFLFYQLPQWCLQWRNASGFSGGTISVSFEGSYTSHTSCSPCLYPGFLLLYANQSTPTYVALRVLSSSLRGWFFVRIRLRATFVPSLPLPRLFSSDVHSFWTFWRIFDAYPLLITLYEFPPRVGKNSKGFEALNTRSLNYQLHRSLVEGKIT